MYYNRRFAYDLEFIYIDDDFFTVMNERWRLYKELKQNPDKLEALSEIEKREILADIRERKKNYTTDARKLMVKMEHKANFNFCQQ